MKLKYRIMLAFIEFFFIELILITCIDQPLSQYMHVLDTDHHQVVDVFRSFTDLGKSKWYLICSGGGVLFLSWAIRLNSITFDVKRQFHRTGEILVFLFLSIAISGIIADIIKPIFGRARPLLMNRDNLYTFYPFTFNSLWNSMPSGHATTAFTLVFVAIAFAPRGRWLWVLCGLMLALSRVVVNAHYLSDVVAGAAVAFASLCLTEFIIRRYGAPLFKKYLFPLSVQSS